MQCSRVLQIWRILSSKGLKSTTVRLCYVPYYQPNIVIKDFDLLTTVGGRDSGGAQSREGSGDASQQLFRPGLHGRTDRVLYHGSSAEVGAVSRQSADD